MKNSYLIVALFTLFLFIGCDSETTAPENPDTIIPLEVGFVAITEKTYTLPNPDSVVVDTFAIIGSTQINGEILYLSSDGDTVMNRSSGYWVMLNGAPYLYVKYPAQVGDTYSSETFIMQSGDTLQAHWEVIAKDTVVVVPADVFKCHLYERVWKRKEDGKPTSIERMWWAPNEGLIQYETNFFNVLGQPYMIYRERLIQ